MLNEIKLLLDGLGYPVYYGSGILHDETEPWNYIVFGRQKLMTSGQNKQDWRHYYAVNITMEEYIAEGFEIEVIKKLTDNLPLRLADAEYNYNYMLKGEGNMVVEMLTVYFVRSQKGMNV